MLVAMALPLYIECSWKPNFRHASHRNFFLRRCRLRNHGSHSNTLALLSSRRQSIARVGLDAVGENVGIVCRCKDRSTERRELSISAFFRVRSSARFRFTTPARLVQEKISSVDPEIASPNQSKRDKVTLGLPLKQIRGISSP